MPGPYPRGVRVLLSDLPERSRHDDQPYLDFDGSASDCWPLTFGGSSADGIAVRAAASGLLGGVLLQGGSLSGSAVSVSDAGAVGVEVSGGTALSGDTIEANGAASNGVDVQNGGTGAVALAVTDSIVGGGVGGVDVHGTKLSTGSLTVSLDHSDFSTTTPNGPGITITAPGTNGNVSGAPLLANIGLGQLGEMLGSPTIGAGTVGVVATDGHRRRPPVFAPGTSCASIDIGAYQFEPSGPPTVVTGAATGVTQTAAALGGTANGGGGAQSAYFQFGPGAPGGGPPSTFTSTTTQCVAPASSASSVPASISGLSPRPSTTTGSWPPTRRARRRPPPRRRSPPRRPRRRRRPAPRSRPRCRPYPPERVGQDVARRRDLLHAQRAGDGDAQSHPPGGRTQLHRRCMAPSAKNHRKPRCTRTLTDSFSLTATSGTNTIRISRVRELGVGRYTVV